LGGWRLQPIWNIQKWVPSLKLTYPLEIGGWETTFLLGMPIFRGYVSFREGRNCIVFKSPTYYIYIYTLNNQGFNSLLNWKVVVKLDHQCVGLPGNVSNVNLIGGFNPYIHQIGNHFSPSLVGVNITKKKISEVHHHSLIWWIIPATNPGTAAMVSSMHARSNKRSPFRMHRYNGARTSRFAMPHRLALSTFFGLGLAGNAGYGVMMLLYKDKCEICEIRVVTTLPIHFPPNVSQSLFSCGKS